MSQVPHSAAPGAEQVAAPSPESDEIRAEIERGGNVNEGYYVLKAARLGDKTLGKLLLSRGANVNETNALGDHPLSVAAHLGHYDFVEWLLANGVDSKKHGGKALLDAVLGMSLSDAQNTSSANIGVYRQVAIIELLVSKGVDVNYRSAHTQRNAAFLAALNGRADVLAYLLKIGVRADLPDNNGKLALDTTIARLVEVERHQRTGKLDMPMKDLARQKQILEWEAQQLLPGLKHTLLALSYVTPGGSDRVVSMISTSSISETQSRNTGSTPSGTLADQVVDAVAECVKMRVSLKSCDQLPWPMSMGCSAVAKSQFSGQFCR